jgi:hypothetical protein
VNSSSWCELHQRIAFPNLGKPVVRRRNAEQTRKYEEAQADREKRMGAPGRA